MTRSAAPVRILPLLALLLVAAPLGACASAVTVGQTVVVLQEPEDYHARERMRLHEEIHKRQYRERGTLSMLATYLFSPSRRLALEAEAYAAELCYMTRIGTKHPAAWRQGFSTRLRGYGFLHRVSQQQAEAHLTAAYGGGSECDRLLILAGRGWMLAASRLPQH